MSRKNPFQIADRMGYCPGCKQYVAEGSKVLPAGESDEGFPYMMHAACAE